MGSAVNLSESYRFRIAGELLTFFKKYGESYEHVLMKALGYAMFRPTHPTLEIEKGIGVRYKPDLIALDAHGKPAFWGECGHVGLRKVSWLAKHSGARQIAIFKLGIVARHFISQLHEAIEPRYRPPSRICLINFGAAVIHEVGEDLHEIPEHWYERHEI